MPLNFVSITPAVIAAADKKPGYSDLIYWCRQSDIMTWSPTLSDNTPGATKRIPGDHTWAADKGVHTLQAKPKSVDGTADSQGEVGGAVLTYKQKFSIKGDSPTINEFFEGILNEDLVFWFNDPVCDQINLIQLGSKCTPANVSSPTFKSGSRGAGGFKEYELTIECPDKFFYEGTLTEVADASLGSPAPLIAGSVEDTSVALTWSAVADAVTYTVERSASASFTSPTTSTVTAPTVTLAVTGLTADTVYYFRVKAVAAGITDGAWATVAVKTDA